MATEDNGVVARVLQLFAERGDSDYGSESVNQREHALQAAHLARQAGADAALVAAALLHDVGHLLHNLPDDAPEQGIDDRHEELGHRWLARHFRPEVAEPVRLHVAAKRYLCSVDDEYYEHLSESSRVSLALQGGPMSAEEAEGFRASPHFEAALRLRRWDDEAKDPDLVVPGLIAYVPDLEAALAGGR